MAYCEYVTTMQTIVFEVSVDDFKKRKFENQFSKANIESSFISDDTLFAKYVNEQDWVRFKSNITSDAVCHQRFKYLMNHGRGFTSSRQNSVIFLNNDIKRIDDLKGQLNKCHSSISKFMRERDEVPMILNIKNKLAIASITERTRQKRRVNLQNCINN